MGRWKGAESTSRNGCAVERPHRLLRWVGYAQPSVSLQLPEIEYNWTVDTIGRRASTGQNSRVAVDPAQTVTDLVLHHVTWQGR